MYTYLLALQNARESWAAFLNPLLFAVSEFAYYCVIVIVFILFLCVDKKKYTPLLFTYSVSNFFMNLIKLTACIHRPWINEPQLHPDKLVRKSATGYSFPSGHTTCAAVFYGSIAYEEARNRKRTLLIISMVLLTLLTAFSRNWLGAHTPLDVIVAIILGFATIICIDKIFEYINNNPDKDILFTIIICILSIASLVWFSTKSYPVEYALDGSLLSDPIEMQMDGWQSTGMLLGIVLCWLIDRRFINFTTDIPRKYKIIRGIIALVLFAVLYMFALKKLEHMINPLIGSFIRSFATMLICVGLYPAVFTKWEKTHLKQC